VIRIKFGYGPTASEGVAQYSIAARRRAPDHVRASRPRMDATFAVLAIVVAIALLFELARRIGLPYPTLFVLGGLALGFVPGLPRLELEQTPADASARVRSRLCFRPRGLM
jgi:hypothetical protein